SGIGLRLHPPCPLHRLHHGHDAGVQDQDGGHREMTGRASTVVMKVYLAIFFIYLYVPLIVMGGATFNTSRFPTVTPWLGTTTKWFGDLAADNRMWDALVNSLIVGGFVILVSVPIGV